MNPLRIGVIDFVNTLPLTRGLEQGIGDDYELVHASPSSLADRLRYGELDAALIPAVEFFRGVGAGLLPGHCIASQGEVESIRLLSREPLENLNSVLVDQSSRSSVAMLRLLLDRLYRVSPDFFSFRPDPSRPFLGPDGEESPASLIIGDAAMELNGGQHGAVVDMDLGAWWQNSFHRPFVYAVWATLMPPEAPGYERLVDLMAESAAIGQRELPLICEETARTKGWPESRVHDYLGRKIQFRLDRDTLRGLGLFRRLCIENYLCPERPEVSEALALLQGELERSPGASA